MLGSGARFGVRFTYMVQGEPKGIACAVNCAKELMGKDPFVAYLGDNLLKNSTRATTKMIVDDEADCVISFMPVAEYGTNQEIVPAVRDRSRPLVRNVSLAAPLRAVDSLKWRNTDYT